MATAQTSKAPTLLRLPQVMARTGLARATVYEAMKRGTFPARIKIGARAVAWREEAIEAWIDGRGTASPTA